MIYPLNNWIDRLLIFIHEKHEKIIRAHPKINPSWCAILTGCVRGVVDGNIIMIDRFYF
jgi:hypothetical protein